jgi:hypothetical protein
VVKSHLPVWMQHHRPLLCTLIPLLLLRTLVQLLLLRPLVQLLLLRPLVQLLLRMLLMLLLRPFGLRRIRLVTFDFLIQPLELGLGFRI